jgi:hypothetical protein
MKEYHGRFVIILQVIYQQKRLTYFHSSIAIILNLANKGKNINWCSIMLTQMSIELTWWTNHQMQIATRLAMPNIKATTCYFRPFIEVYLQH